jgi:hypothetical protein
MHSLEARLSEILIQNNVITMLMSPDHQIIDLFVARNTPQWFRLVLPAKQNIVNVPRAVGHLITTMGTVQQKKALLNAVGPTVYGSLVAAVLEAQ